MQTHAGVEILADLPGVPKSSIQVTFEHNVLTLQVHPHPPATDSSSAHGHCACHEPSQAISLDANQDSSNHTGEKWSPAGSWGSKHRLAVDTYSGEDSWDPGSPCLKRQSFHYSLPASYWHPQPKIVINERTSVNRFLSRKLELPAGMDADSAEAVFAGGVLRIVVPKRSAPVFINIG